MRKHKQTRLEDDFDSAFRKNDEKKENRKRGTLHDTTIFSLNNPVNSIPSEAENIAKAIAASQRCFIDVLPLFQRFIAGC